MEEPLKAVGEAEKGSIIGKPDEDRRYQCLTSHINELDIARKDILGVKSGTLAFHLYRRLLISKGEMVYP